MYTAGITVEYYTRVTCRLNITHSWPVKLSSSLSMTADIPELSVQKAHISNVV